MNFSKVEEIVNGLNYKLLDTRVEVDKLEAELSIMKSAFLNSQQQTVLVPPRFVRSFVRDDEEGIYHFS